MPKPRRQADHAALRQMPAVEPVVRAPLVIPGNPGRRGRISIREAAVSEPTAAAPNEPIRAHNWGTRTGNTPQHFSDAAVDAAAAVNYPFRVFGQLEFEQGRWIFTCSAQLVSKSILLTAGHCVHSRSGWHKNMRFIPAKHGGSEPFGRVRAASMYTTAQWINNHALGQGSDVALVVLHKRADDTEIGAEIGWLGLCLEDCVQNYRFLTTLAYPGNYMNGNALTSSQHLSIKSPDSNGEYFYGTGMEDGASGGAHVENLGALSDSSAAGQFGERNVAFAVESYGPVGGQKIGWAAVTSGHDNRNRFKEMFNKACEKARELHGNNSCDLVR